MALVAPRRGEVAMPLDVALMIEGQDGIGW